MTWRKWETEQRNRIKEQKRRWHYFFRYIAPPIVSLIIVWAASLYVIDLIPSRRLFYALIISLFLYFIQLTIIVYIWWQGHKNGIIQLPIVKGSIGPPFLFFLSAFVFMVIFFHYSHYEEIIVNQFGVATTATVVDTYVTRSRRHTIYHVELQYVGKDRTYQTTRTISDDMFYRLERGDSMAIRYWPDKPQSIAWNDVSQTRVNLGAIVTNQFILLALMGLGLRQIRQAQSVLDT